MHHASCIMHHASFSSHRSADSGPSSNWWSSKRPQRSKIWRKMNMVTECRIMRQSLYILDPPTQTQWIMFNLRASTEQWQEHVWVCAPPLPPSLPPSLALARSLSLALALSSLSPPLPLSLSLSRPPSVMCLHTYGIRKQDPKYWADVVLTPGTQKLPHPDGTQGYPRPSGSYPRDQILLAH